MNRSWTFTASGIPPGPNDRLHWRARHRLSAPLRDEIAWQARAATMAMADAPIQQVRVTMTFYRKGGQVADIDNLHSAGKPLVDGLVSGGLLVGDGPKHITVTIDQKRGKARCVVLHVEEVA